MTEVVIPQDVESELRLPLACISLEQFRALKTPDLHALMDTHGADGCLTTPEGVYLFPGGQEIKIGREVSSNDIVMKKMDVSGKHTVLEAGYTTEGGVSYKITNTGRYGTKYHEGDHISHPITDSYLRDTSGVIPASIEIGSSRLPLVTPDSALPHLPFLWLRQGTEIPQDQLKLLLAASRAAPVGLEIPSTGGYNKIFPLRAGHNTLVRVRHKEKNPDYYDDYVIQSHDQIVQLHNAGYSTETLVVATVSNAGDLTIISNSDSTRFAREYEFEKKKKPEYRQTPPDPDIKLDSPIQQIEVEGHTYSVNLKKLFNRTETAGLRNSEKMKIATELMKAYHHFCKMFGDQIPLDDWEPALFELTEVVADDEWGTVMGKASPAGHHHGVRYHKGIPHAVSLQLEYVQKLLKRNSSHMHQLAIHEWLHHYDIQSDKRIDYRRYSGVVEGLVDLYSIVGAKTMEKQQDIEDVMLAITDREIDEYARATASSDYLGYTRAMLEIARKFKSGSHERASDLDTLMKVMLSGEQDFAEVIGRNIMVPGEKYAPGNEGFTQRGNEILNVLQAYFAAKDYDGALRYAKSLETDGSATEIARGGRYEDEYT